MRHLALGVALCLTFSYAAPATQLPPGNYQFSGGTGFTVNNRDIITNAHVVDDCRAIYIYKDGTHVPVTRVAYDAKPDLAVLRAAPGTFAATAQLRFNRRDLAVRTPVYLIGFPGDRGVLKGTHTFKKTRIASLKAAPDIALEPVAERGNSGGAILDASGNVIGVVKAISKYEATHARQYLVNQETGERRFVKNVAITPIRYQQDIGADLSSLERFLAAHSISHQLGHSTLSIEDDRAIEQKALAFTFSIRCVQRYTPHTR